MGWDEAKLNAALDLAGERASTGVVVLHHGRIMAERYWELEKDALWVWSAADLFARLRPEQLEDIRCLPVSARMRVVTKGSTLASPWTASNRFWLAAGGWSA